MPNLEILRYPGQDAALFGQRRKLTRPEIA
jgi:hypothetical protein